jgi:ribosomal protein S18 acetylase RimI-like enzyme
MSELTIRPYGPADERAVLALWQSCGLTVPHNDPQKDIARKLRVNPEWFLVGEESGTVVASCMAGYEGHRGWVNYLAVISHRQRRGIAGQMMREAERLLKEAGCPKINLQVRASNAAVIRFYEGLGFKQDPVLSLGKRLESDEARANLPTPPGA